MNELNALHAWIQPQHLEDDALKCYEKSFAAHPAAVLVIKHFLLEPVAARLATFLREEAEFQLEYGVYSVEGRAVREEEWSDAAEENKFFRLSKLARPLPQYNLSPNMLVYLRFRKAFQEQDLKLLFQKLSGMTLGCSDDFGSHSMKAGDFLRPHTDDNSNRALALVLYLSPDWQPRFGGALNIVDQQGHTTRIEAEYNSLVAFDVAAGSSHFVEPIRSEAENRARLTIGGWYHKPS